MNAVPIIIPLSSNNGSSSYTQRCLEETDLSDLYKKALNNEDFTDEDTKRLTDCIDKKKEEHGKLIVVLLVIVVIAIVAMIVFMIVT